MPHKDPEQFRLWKIGALTLGTFAVGTDAFVIAGILPEVARSMRVTVADAGQLVTVFAISYALLSPLLAACTGHWPRRRVLTCALVVFIAGNAVTALAPTFAAVLASRALAAAGAAMLSPTANAAAAALAPPARRARALAVVTAGFTASTALGAPLGAMIGHIAGWRTTMWCVVALAIAALAAMLLWLPPVPESPALSLRGRLSPLRRPRVVATLFSTLLFFTGIYIAYTYISAAFQDAVGGDERRLAALLCLSGLMGTVGNISAGALADRYGPAWTLRVAALVLIIDLAAIPCAGPSGAMTALLVAVFGWSSWSVPVLQQHRLAEAAPDSAGLLISLNASFLYLGAATAGVVGAMSLRLWGPAWLGPLSAAFVFAGLLVSPRAHHAR